MRIWCMDVDSSFEPSTASTSPPQNHPRAVWIAWPCCRTYPSLHTPSPHTFPHPRGKTLCLRPHSSTMFIHNLHELSTDLSTDLVYWREGAFCRWIGSCSHQQEVFHTFGPFIHGIAVVLRHVSIVELNDAWPLVIKALYRLHH